MFLNVVSNNGHFVIFLLNSTPIIFSSLWAFLLGSHLGILDTNAVQVLFLGYGIKVPHVSVCLYLPSCVAVNSCFCFVFFFFKIHYIYHDYYYYYSEVQSVLTLTNKSLFNQLLWPLILTLLIFEHSFFFFFFFPPWQTFQAFLVLHYIRPMINHVSKDPRASFILGNDI